MFAIFGLHADGAALDLAALKKQYRFALLPHLFQRDDEHADTVREDVSTWAQDNTVCDAIRGLNGSALFSLQQRWAGRNSVQTWNPFAAPGSAETFDPTRNTVNGCDFVSPSCCQPNANVRRIQYPGTTMSIPPPNAAETPPGAKRECFWVPGVG